MPKPKNNLSSAQKRNCIKAAFAAGRRVFLVGSRVPSNAPTEVSDARVVAGVLEVQVAGQWEAFLGDSPYPPYYGNTGASLWKR
jgi:hypothetical protein